MYDLDTIRKMNKESGDADILGEAMTYAEVCAAADAERDIDAECSANAKASADAAVAYEEWPEPRNDR